MTTQEIEKAAEEYQVKIYTDVYEEGSLEEQELQCINDFKAGGEFVNKYWQEKTRWKSLETEPPTIFGERVQVILKNKHGELSLAPVYSDRSIEDYLDFGFIEWKEIE